MIISMTLIRSKFADYRMNPGNEKILLIFVFIALALFLQGAVREGFYGYGYNYNSTYCWPCEKQTSSDPTFCLACNNCTYVVDESGRGRCVPISGRNSYYYDYDYPYSYSPRIGPGYRNWFTPHYNLWWYR